MTTKKPLATSLVCL